MSEKATVIREIQSKFTANITDYRKKVEQLSGLVSHMTKNLDAVQRTAASAMRSPSESTQKLGRALDATARKLQSQKEKFDGLTKSGERTAQQMEQLNQKLSGMSNAYRAIQSAATTIDLSTPIQKQADAAKAAVERIDVEVERLAAAIKNAGQNPFVFLDSGEMLGIDQARARLDQLAQSGVEAVGKLDLLQEAIRSIGTENLGYANAKGLERLQSKIDAATSKLGSLGDKMSGTAEKAEHLADSMRGTKEKLDQQSESLSKSTRRFDALKNVMSGFASAAGGGLSAVRNRIAGIGSSAGGSTNRVERLLRSIRRISLVSLTLRVVRPIFGELTSCVNRYMEQNEAAAASIERLRDGLTNALAPAINVVINLLNQLLPYLIGIADAVASLITNIFGTGWTTVSTGGTAAADSVADSAGKASDKVDDLTDSTKDAADAQEKYNKLIAGFDEITKLEEQPSATGGNDGADDGSGGSGGGSGGATQTTAPGTEGIAGKLPEWLEELANQLKELFEAQDFTGIGELLATKFGDLVDYLDAKLTDPEFQQKVSNACQHIVDGINGFFTEMTYSDGTKDSIATRTGNLIGDALSLCLNTLDQFLTGVEWDKIGITVAQNINGALEKLNANDVKFGTIIADLINAGIDALSGFANEVRWAEIGTFIADNVNSFFETTDWGKAGETARKLIEGLGEMLGTAIRKIDLGTIEQAFDDFLSSAGWVGDLALDVALAFGTVKAVGTAAKILEALGLVEGVAAADLSLAVGFTVGIATAFEGFAGLAAMLFGTDEEKEAAREKAENSGIWWDLGNGIADALNSALDGAVEIAVSVKDNVEEMWSNIKTWWSDYVDRVGEKLQCFVEVADQAEEWWENVKNWWSEKVGNVAAFWTDVKNQAGEWWSSVKGWWSDKVGKVAEFWTDVKNQSSDWWSSVKSWWSGKVGKVSEFYTGVKNQAGTWWSNVKRWWKSKAGNVGTFYATIKNNISTLWGNVKRWWGTKYLSVKLTVSGMVSGLKSWINVHVIAPINRHLPFGIKIPKLAMGGVVNGPMYAMLGEAGQEAVVPLKNNTEWTGVVAKLITEQMSTMPNIYNPSPALSSGDQDLSELVVLLRELRSDVAAIKQGEKKLSVTVQNNLDGQKLADNTVTRIIQQTRATGVNPLSAYI